MEGSKLITCSRINALKRCMRYHYLSYEVGLRKIVDAAPLRMGSVIHLGLDLKAQGKSDVEAIETACASYEVCPATIDQYEWDIERQTCICLLYGYFKYWENAQIEYVATEKPFELPICNPETGAASRSFKQAGKRDKIVKADGRTLLMEHKTTSDSLDPESNYWRRLRLDTQISMYYSACQAEGIDVQGVLYDVIRKPALGTKQIPVLDENGIKIVHDATGQRVMLANGKPRQTGDTALGYTLLTKRETPEEFGERLFADIADRPTYYYARKEIARLNGDIDELQQELWQTTLLLRERENAATALWAKGKDPACAWPRNSQSCIGFGTCVYFDVCAGGLDPRTDVIPGFSIVEACHPELKESEQK